MNSYVLKESNATADIWHARYGHITEEKLKQALNVTKVLKLLEIIN